MSMFSGRHVKKLSFKDRLNIRTSLRKIISEILEQYKPQVREQILNEIAAVTGIMLLDYCEDKDDVKEEEY